MSIRINQNLVFTGQDALNAINLDDLSYAEGSLIFYCDVGRTDTYIEDGSPSRPYKSAKSAIDAANLVSTMATPCMVSLSPGIYNEDPITIGPYVRVVGSGWISTILKANDLTNHFITMSPATVIRLVNIWGPTTAGKACIFHGDSDPRSATVLEVSISRGSYGVYCNPTVSVGTMLVQNLLFAYGGTITDKFVKAEGFSNIYVSQGICTAPADKVVTGFEVTGANAVLTLISPLFEVSGTTDAIFVDNGANCIVQGGLLAKGNNALHVGNNGASYVRTEGLAINDTIAGFTKDIKIDSAVATVLFGGTCSAQTKLDVTAGATFRAVGMDVTTGSEGGFTLGEHRVGTDPTKMLPMAAYGKAAYLSGLVSGGAVTRNAGPSLVLNVALGSGYVNDGVDPVYVSWSGTTVTIAANKTEYVYVTKAGVVSHSEIQPAYAENIILAQTVANATDIVLLTRDEIEIRHSLSRIQEFFEDVLGPISVSGGIATASATALKIDVSPGEFVIGISERDITGGGNVPFYYVSQDGAGGWTYTASTVIDTAHIDLGSGPVVYPGADHWKKDAWYVVVDDSGETYYCVYGQVAYTDQAAAENGAFPVAPPILQHYGMRGAGIVSHKEDAVLTSVLDVRPMLGQNSPVTAAVAADHDLLLNLGHDTHIQYFTAARALTAHGTYPGAHVTGGDTHTHTGGAGAQIDHTELSNIGTRTHLQLESDIAAKISSTEKGAALGVASLNASTKVVEDPANATATPTAGKIPIADGSGKLDGWVNLPVFGKDYQSSVDVSRTTITGTTAFQNKLTLTTPALTGTYRIGWQSVVDLSVVNQNVELQLYNNTDTAVVGVVQIYRPGHASSRMWGGGSAEIVFTGVAKTFYVQFRTASAGATAGCADARIEIWRVS